MSKLLETKEKPPKSIYQSRLVRFRVAENQMLGQGGIMFLPNEGSFLLYRKRRSLRRSLRRVRSNARLYEALADRETDKVSREVYRLHADLQRGSIPSKLSSLFSLRAGLPSDREGHLARTWRSILILCGPKVSVAWVEWRETRELTLILLVARAITILARLQGRREARPTS